MGLLPAFRRGRGRIGIFRPATGLWAIRGLTRAYLGGEGDYPVPAVGPLVPAPPFLLAPMAGQANLYFH